MNSLLFGSSYWINDPYNYRLPPAYGPYRWVRYYNDALLVDTYTGEVVDVVYDIFWCDHARAHRVCLGNRGRAISEAAPARSTNRPPNASILWVAGWGRTDEHTRGTQSLMRI